MHRNERRQIDDFLAQHRLAFIGVSRHEKDFTRSLLREFAGRGYEVVPVHPEATEIEGIPCVRSIRDVSPAVDGALVLTASKQSAGVVKECVEAGVPRVWLYGSVTQGAVSEEAVELCDKSGVPVVAGECPFMFLSGSGGVHSVHRFFRLLTGRLPR